MLLLLASNSFGAKESELGGNGDTMAVGMGGGGGGGGGAAIVVCLLLTPSGEVGLGLGEVGVAGLESGRGVGVVDES